MANKYRQQEEKIKPLATSSEDAPLQINEDAIPSEEDFEVDPADFGVDPKKHTPIIEKEVEKPRPLTVAEKAKEVFGMEPVKHGMVRVKLMKHIGNHLPGDIIEVSSEEAKYLTAKTVRQDGTPNGRVIQKAMLLADAEQLESTPIDIRKLTLGEARAMGLKNFTHEKPEDKNKTEAELATGLADRGVERPTMAEKAKFKEEAEKDAPKKEAISPAGQQKPNGQASIADQNSKLAESEHKEVKDLPHADPKAYESKNDSKQELLK